MEIKVETNASSLALVHKLLESEAIADVILVRRTGDRETTRGIDPSVLVAVVGAAGTGLGALIAGALKVVEQAKAARLVIKGANGWSVEAPSDLPADQLKSIIDAAREHQVESISFSK